MCSRGVKADTPNMSRAYGRAPCAPLWRWSRGGDVSRGFCSRLRAGQHEDERVVESAVESCRPLAPHREEL